MSLDRVLVGYALAVWASLVLVVAVGDHTGPTFTLALFSFWWLLPSIPLLVVALARRGWVSVSLLLVPALVVALQCLPRHPGAGSGHPDLRVTTWNITQGAPTTDVAAFARATHPDVLLVQEVTPQSATQLAHLRSTYPYVWLAPLSGKTMWNSGNANGVYSRYPIVAVKHVTGLPPQSRPTDEVILSVGGRMVTVISVHLASPCVACGPQARANPAGNTTNAARVRLAEARRIRAVASAADADGRAVIVAGDINSSVLNAPLGILAGGGLVDAYRQVAWGPGLTRGSWPGLARVDVVLVAGLSPVHADVGSPGASTHAPVTVDLSWT